MLVIKLALLVLIYVALNMVEKEAEEEDAHIA